MFYIYFLQSKKDGGIYIGRTNDINRRFLEHNAGQVSSTKSRRPFILLGYKTCGDLKESIKIEKEYKKGFKREQIKRHFKI